MIPRCLKTFFLTVIVGGVFLIITDFMKTNETEEGPLFNREDKDDYERTYNGPDYPGEKGAKGEETKISLMTGYVPVQDEDEESTVKVDRSRGMFNLIQSGKTKEVKERNHFPAEKQIEDLMQGTTESEPPIDFPLRVHSHRVLCGIMTNIKYAKKGAYAVNRTWARRCDYPHFIFSESNKRNWTLLGAVNLPVKEGWNFLTEKTQAMFRWAYSTYKDKVDWYMKADDDTYVIMENLKYLLAGIDPDKPYYLGARLINMNEPYGYHNGGAGFLLSREATRILVEIGPTVKGCPQKGSGEDVDIGKCMEVLNVSLVEAIDDDNNMAFHWFSAISWLKNKPRKYNQYRCTDKRETPRRVYSSTDEMPDRHWPLSTRAVSFHHLEVGDIHLLEYLIYGFCVKDTRMCRGRTLPAIQHRTSDTVKNHT